MAYISEVKGIPKAGSSVPELMLSPYWWSVDSLRAHPRLHYVYTPGYNDSEGVFSLAELLELNDQMIEADRARGRTSRPPNVVASMAAFLEVLAERGDEFEGFVVAVREWESGLDW